MTQRACGMALVLVFLSLASTAMSQQYYLYSPETVSAGTKANKADGEILVSEIVIRKGDTLSRLSRKYSGKGSYFPQILLFNDIRNPDLIYTGDLIRIPVKNESTGTSATSHRHKSSAKTHPAKVLRAKPAPAIENSALNEPRKSDGTVSKELIASEQKQFNQAFKDYNAGDCRSAIEKFDRFLSNNSGSPMAADATLYKADCLLKLSGQ